MEKFVLDDRLAADTVHLTDWALSRVLLMNDARYPWLILVPRRAGLVEFHDLAHAERMVLCEEIARASRGLKAHTAALKINVGALGNVVAQLHVHVVARNPGDAAWSGPVWGHGAREPYGPGALERTLSELAVRL
jgi:diadenosine tetraphosphate (Ap4A) HIT family hydrolase